MKHSIQKNSAAVLLLLLIISLQVHSQTSALFAVVQNGKSGYIDKTGKLIVPCQYDEIKETYNLPGFSDGLIGFVQNGAWGMLDVSGKIVIKPLYVQQIFFSKSYFAQVRIKKEGSTSNWWFGRYNQIIIDKKGNSVLPGEFELTYSNIFGDMLVYFKNGLNNSFANIRTKQVSDKSFGGISSFGNGCGVAQAELYGNYGIIDEKGNWLVNPKYYEMQQEENGWFQVTIDEDGKWAFIDKSANVVLGPFNQYGRAKPFYYASFSKEGLLPVQDKNTALWGYINTTGKLVIPCKYNAAAEFSEGISIVNEGGTKQKDEDDNITIKNAEWKAIDATGKVLFKIAGCSQAFDFSEGRCGLKVGVQSALIDTKGNFIVAPQSVNNFYRYNNGLCLFKNSNGFGYYDLNGKIVWEASK